MNSRTPDAAAQDKMSRVREELLTGLGLIGLLLAIAGAGMQGFLNFNQHRPIFDPSDLTLAILSVISPVTQIVGAIIVFVKSLVGATKGSPGQTASS
jgi:hypothetical protein